MIAPVLINSSLYYLDFSAIFIATNKERAMLNEEHDP
jgi:hypothetical protein